ASGAERRGVARRPRRDARRRGFRAHGRCARPRVTRSHRTGDAHLLPGAVATHDCDAAAARTVVAALARLRAGGSEPRAGFGTARGRRRARPDGASLDDRTGVAAVALALGVRAALARGRAALALRDVRIRRRTILLA